MLSLKIDGNDIQIEKGATILAAAEKAGIRIPTLCYLKKISPTGACRICVVEVQGCTEPMTACNTPAIEGMVVTTQSEKLARIRRQVVELLLVNHPLDCPVCDAAGECDLQESCVENGVVTQPFSAEDLGLESIESWPLIQQVPSRCILCEKCVKVCHEVVGASALVVRDCGEKAFIDTHDGAPLSCEFCGNCVEACPTGTLISKPFKHSARPWALSQVPSVCSTCGCQCQIDYGVMGGKVMRVTSQDGVTRNDGNLCIGGYFGHDAIHAPSRLSAPTVAGEVVTWQRALDEVSSALRTLTDSEGGAAVAGLSSPQLSNEENYLFQKLFRVALGSNNIDSEARFGALRTLQTLQRTLGLHGASNRIESIALAEAVLVFGADVTAEAPAVDWQIGLACRKNDAKLVVATMRRTKLSAQANSRLGYRPGSEVALANALCRLILDEGLADQSFIDRFCENPDELSSHLAALDLDLAVSVTGLSLEALRDAARLLGQASSVALVFGADLIKSEGAEAKIAALSNLAMITGALHGEAGGLFPLDEKPNTQGLLDQGVYPEALPGYHPYGSSRAPFEKAWNVSLPEGGLDATGILEGIEAGTIKALYLAGTNPLVSFPQSARWASALKKLDLLVVQDLYDSPLTRMAHVVLPASSGAEKSGTLTSLDHRINSLNAAIAPLGDSRSDFHILAHLYGMLRPAETPCMESLRKEMKSLCGLYADTAFSISGQWLKQMYSPEAKSLEYAPVDQSELVQNDLELLSGKILYHFGTTTTHSKACLTVFPAGAVAVSPEDAEKMGLSPRQNVRLSSSEGAIDAPVGICDSLPQGLLFAPHHFEGVAVQGLMPAGSNRVAVQLSKI